MKHESQQPMRRAADCWPCTGCPSVVRSCCVGAAPEPETVKAWDQYYAWANQKVEREMSDPRRFLIEDFLPSADQASIRQQLESGGIVVRRMTGCIPPGAKFHVPHGEIHHWWGAVLVPNVRLTEMIAFAQDYDHQAGRFADVEKSRLLKKEGDHFEFFFRLRRTKAFVTVYYNSWQECNYYPREMGASGAEARRRRSPNWRTRARRTSVRSLPLRTAATSRDWSAGGGSNRRTRA